MTSGPTPLLTLETYAPAEHYVLIDGTPYYLLGARDVGFATWARITRITREIAALQATGDQADEAAQLVAFQRIDALLSEVLDLIAPAWPADVRGALNPGQKLAIAEAFSQAVRPATEPGPATPPIADAALPTGASSSPGSTTTTARRRRTAATGSRSR